MEGKETISSIRSASKVVAIHVTVQSSNQGNDSTEIVLNFVLVKFLPKSYVNVIIFLVHRIDL